MKNIGEHASDLRASPLFHRFKHATMVSRAYFTHDRAALCRLIQVRGRAHAKPVFLLTTRTGVAAC